MKRPTALTIVAWLFVTSGAFAFVGIAMDLFAHAKINFDFTVLNWWIGRWLLNSRERGYRWGIIVLKIGLVVLPIASLVMVLSGLPLDFRVFGYPVGHMSRLAFLAFAGALFLLTIWQYVVLRQAAARGVFVKSAEKEIAAASSGGDA